MPSSTHPQVLPHEDGKNIRYKLVTGPPVDRLCEFCSQPHHVGGPVWIDPIHDAEFVAGMLGALEEDEERDEEEEGGRFGTHARMKGMLTVVSEELMDVPFYYRQDKLCSLVRTSSARLVDFRSAIMNAGYRVSLSHACKNTLKTDAPNQFVFDMIRAWERLHPTNRDKLDRDSVAWKLLNAESVNTDVSMRNKLIMWNYSVNRNYQLHKQFPDFVRPAPRRQPCVEGAAVEEVSTKPRAELGTAQDGNSRNLV